MDNYHEAIHILSEKQGWNDGSPEKIALHSFFAGIEGEFSGNGFMSGALAGGVNNAEKEWASEFIFGIVVRDRNGDVIYDFPEDPQDFIPEGLAKKNIQILEIPICILVIGFQMQMGKLKENSYVVGYKKNED